MDIVGYLTKVIGPRSSRSAKELEAVEFISKSFKSFRELNLEPEIQKLRYLGWQQKEPPPDSFSFRKDPPGFTRGL